jgi:hypothetical protein
VREIVIVGYEVVSFLVAAGRGNHCPHRPRRPSSCQTSPLVEERPKVWPANEKVRVEGLADQICLRGFI